MSLRVGTEPSPVATTAWVQPWVPLYLEWQLSLRLDDTLTRWTLCDVDLEPAGDPDPGAPIATRVYSGRSLLTSVAARTFSSQVSSFLAQETARGPGGGVLQPVQDSAIGEISSIAWSLDLLSASLSDLRPQLMGLSLADAARTHADATGTPVLPAPIASPLLIRGGTAWFSALRIVDAFGRTVDLSPGNVLAGAQLQLPPPPAPTTTRSPGTATSPSPPASSAAAPAASPSAATSTGSPGSSPGPPSSATSPPAPAPQLLLRPRMSRPARLCLDFVDASAQAGTEAALAMVDQQEPVLTISPASGWLLPDHFDGFPRGLRRRRQPARLTARGPEQAGGLGGCSRPSRPDRRATCPGAPG